MIMTNVEDFQVRGSTTIANGERAFRVRTMQIPDLPAVAELEKASFSTPWSPNSLTHELLVNPHSYALVIEHRGNVIGYSIGWMYDNEAHIGTFGIHPKFRKNSLGSFLLRTLLEYCKYKGVQFIYLEVRRSNVPAQKLYLKHGFTIFGIRKNYYSKDKEDALLMSLSI